MAEQAKLRVLGRPRSINVRKVLWTAAEAGLAVAHEPEWGLSRDLRDPEFLALNPHGLMPVLVHGDTVLWESNTICRYLAGIAGCGDLVPVDPAGRARIEKWMDWQVSDLNTAWRDAFLGLVRLTPGYVGDEAAIVRSVRQWNRLMLRLEARLGATGAYVAGDTFTLADVVLGLSVQRWLLTPIERPDTPALLAYRERLLGRPACVASISPDEP